MSSSSDVGAVLRALAGVLEAEQIRWYVFGAQAVVAYGLPRLTADLDVTAELPVEQVGSILPRLEEAGFHPRSDDPVGLAQRSRVLLLVHAGSGLPVDLVLAGPGLEGEFLDHARRLRLGGVEVPVISPEDLLVTKLLAGREKDMDDALGVLRLQRRQLDLERVRSFLGLLEQALDRRDLLAELKRLADRAEQ